MTHLGRTRRLMAKTALAAIALSSVVPIVARASNESCATQTQMTERGVAVPPTPAAAYPPAGVGSGTVDKAKSNWWNGVFHDVVLVAQAPLSLYLYEYINDGTGCTKLVQQCHSDGSGPNSPARCQINTESRRHIVEVRNTGDSSVGYELISIYHCYAKDALGNCVVATP